MFRRVFSSASKFSVWSGSTTVAAAAAVVALSDKELAKKPLWYQEAVTKMESSLISLGRQKPIENIEVLDQAQDIFTRVVDYNNAEISWRLARVLVEKSDLSTNACEKVHLLREAVEHFYKAFSVEPSRGCAGAHKWYAVALSKLALVDKKHKALAHANEDIFEHLQKSIKIDPNDPFTHHYLGIYHFNKNNEKEALNAFQKAETIRPEFSATNTYYIGLIYTKQGEKDLALQFLKKTLRLPTDSVLDGKSKVKAKEILLTELKQKWEDVNPIDDY